MLKRDIQNRSLDEFFTSSGKKKPAMATVDRDHVPVGMDLKPSKI